MALEVIVVKPCGFCATGHVDRCATGVKMEKHNKYKGGVVWVCQNAANAGRRKCTYCNNRTTDEISPETWECFDTEACRSTVEARRAADPLLNQLREVKERAKMAKIEDNKTKAEKAPAAPKVGSCVCCGGATKGGLFLPGHDARYVSTLVKGVAEAGFTAKSKDAARKTLTGKGVSDALVAKFDKGVGIAEDKKAKADAAAKEKAAAKEQAKADKATASA